MAEGHLSVCMIFDLDFKTNRYIHISAVAWPYSRTRIKSRTLGKVLLIENIIDARPDHKKRIRSDGGVEVPGRIGRSQSLCATWWWRYCV